MSDNLFSTNDIKPSCEPYPVSKTIGMSHFKQEPVQETILDGRVKLHQDQ